MLTIRFNRIGKKNKAFFRLVLQEHTIAPGGGHVEILGSYDPHLKKESLKPERIKYWVEKGVKLSDTAYNFLVSEGLIDGKKRAVKIPKKPARSATQSVAGGAEAPVVAEKLAEPKTEEKKEEASVEIKKDETKKEENPKPARNASHNEAGGQSVAGGEEAPKPARNASDSDAGGEKVKKEEASKKEEKKEKDKPKVEEKKPEIDKK